MLQLRQCRRLPSAVASRRLVAAVGGGGGGGNSVTTPVVQKCRAITTQTAKPSKSYSSFVQNREQQQQQPWRVIASSRGASSQCYQTRRFSSTLPPHDVVGMPALSPTMEAGTITEWRKEEGSVIKAGDIICLVETDKTTVDFEAQDESVLAKILVPAGSEVKVGSPIMVVCDDPDHVGAFANFAPDAAPKKEAAAPPPPPPPSSPPPPPAAAPAPAPPKAAPAGSGSGSGRVVASPLAKKLAGENGYDISAITGTGPGGRVIAADVKEFEPSQAATAVAGEPAAPAGAAEAQAPSKKAPAAAAASVAATTQVKAGDGFIDTPVSDAAREIADRLTATKQTVPHFCLAMDVKLDALLKVRKQLNAGLSEDDKLSLNDMLLKAASVAMKKVPDVNASWMDSFVRQFHKVDINVLVGVGDGMVAPVVKNVGGRGLVAVSRDIKALAKAAQSSSLTADQCAMGTFTVVNVGMYGVKSASPIINAPQSCILALGVASERVMPNEDPKSEEIYQLNQMMTATLTCDHRVVDGAVGAQWMAAFKGLVEDPVTMLL